MTSETFKVGADTTVSRPIQLIHRSLPEGGRRLAVSSFHATSLGFRDHLRIEDGQVTVEGVPCSKLAEQFGTPLYVLSETRIRHNLRAFHGALGKVYRDVLVCPAYKANSHLAVSRIYGAEGAGAEVVSTAELKIALEAGVEPGKIVYNGPVKKAEDLQLAVSSNVGLINVDSLPELERMQEAARRVNKRCNVGIRVNLGIRAETHPHLATAEREHKFGIWVDDAVAAYKEAVRKAALNVVGVHSHIGSNITQPQVFREMVATILELVRRVKETIGVKLTEVDVGGGLGFPYQADSPRIGYDEYASAIVKENIAMLEQLGNPTLIFEPGRAIIADAGLLLTRVEVVKRQGDLNWAIIDAGMNTLIRPALYGAKHQVIVADRPEDQARVTYNIGGPCCESGDVVARGVPLQQLRGGGLLAVLDVGAYGYTMSSNYNGQPRPAVVLVTDGRGQLIRRRESYEDLIAGEIVPPHLQGRTSS